MRVPIAVLVVFAAACTPGLDGVCNVDADCGRADEFCSGGICLRRSGGEGPLAVDVTSPAGGAQLPRAFHVAAHVTGGADGVTFIVANSATGAPLGQLAVATGAAQTWSGTLTLDAVAFGGAANVRAVAHRGGQAEVVSAAVPVVIDQNAPAIASTWSEEWYPRDAGLAVTATVADDRSGVASAELLLPDGGVYAASIAGSTATFAVPGRDLAAEGAVSSVPFTLSATDVAGNRVSAEGGVLQVDDEPPAINLDPVSTTAWFGGPIDFTANVSDGVGSGVASAELVLNGHPAAADPPSGTAWAFHANVAHLLPGVEGPITVKLTATDAVGNAGSAEQIIQVDTVGPMVSAVQVDSVPDGVDTVGQGWFRGPSGAPAATDVIVSAAISDANLVASGAEAPVAIAGGTRYPGTAASGRWTFAIPRSMGLGAGGPVAVTFDAQDLAGNHPAGSPSVALYFDDAAADTFKPAIAADATWYARGAGLRPSVAVTFPMMPASGISSLVLQVATQADIACTRTARDAWTCSLPSTCAPAGAETTLPFGVAATSAVGVSSASSGSRNIDDAPPVVSNAAAIQYPAATGAMAWSHDGAHYNVRDSGILYTFKAHDCGSGVSSATALSLSPLPSTRAVKVNDSGVRQGCANGNSAAVYDVVVSADLSTMPPSAFPAADNVLNLSVTLVDAASDGGSGLVQHPATQTKAVAVTRRLWQTGSLGISRLALGPALIAASSSAVSALSPADGSSLWSLAAGTVLAGPAVSGPPDSAAVYFATGSPSTPGAKLHQVSAADGRNLANDCVFVATPNASCTGGLRTHSASLALAADGTPVLADNFLVTEGIASPAGELSCWSAAFVLARGCSAWLLNTPNHNLDGLSIGRQGHAFFIDTQTSPATGAQTQELQERDLGSTAISHGPACGALDLITDSAGADAPACNGGRYVFNGGAWPPLWVASASPSRTLPSLDLYLSSDGAAYSLASGAAIQGFNGAGAPLLLDGSGTPVLYSASGANLSALRINGGGYGSTAVGLPGVPGPAIGDALLDGKGTLFIASNGQVSAIATPSPGPAAGTAWATRSRDNCRSSNLEFACPY